MKENFPKQKIHKPQIQEVQHNQTVQDKCKEHHKILKAAKERESIIFKRTRKRFTAFSTQIWKPKELFILKKNFEMKVT